MNWNFDFFIFVTIVFFSEQRERVVKKHFIQWDFNHPFATLTEGHEEHEEKTQGSF